MRHVLWTLVAAAGAMALPAAGTPVGASGGAAGQPLLVNAAANLQVDTDGPDKEVGAQFDFLFDESISSSGRSEDGDHRDRASAAQTTVFTTDVDQNVLAGVSSDSFVDASADVFETGGGESAEASSTLSVDILTDGPIVLVVEGVLGASIDGASGSCSTAQFQLIPGPVFTAQQGVDGCAGTPEVVLDEEIPLDTAGSYTIHLSGLTRPSTEESGHADGSASWNVDIALCPNVFTDGDDTIDGTDGDDILCGGDGEDTINGGPGFDIIFGGDGGDTVNGGPGFDELHGGDGGDGLEGGLDPDSLSGESGNDFLGGGPGVFDDDLYGGPGADDIDGGPGDDTLLGAGDTTSGVDLGDSLVGGPGNDFIRAALGRDEVQGGLGDDEADGGPGDDTMRGGPGSDTLRGQDGADDLFGNQRKDALVGGDGNDFLNGCDGVRDVLTGGPGGNDRARADGNDSVSGSTEDVRGCGGGNRAIPVGVLRAEL